MGSKQMFLAFVCICGFAWIFYYTIHNSGSFSVTRTQYSAVNGVVSLTGFLSVSQQQLEGADNDQIHLMQVNSVRRKPVDHSLEILTVPTMSTTVIDTNENSMEELEKFTVNRPSKTKLEKFALSKDLDKKLLRNDERKIKRIVDDMQENQSAHLGDILRKSGKLIKRLPNVIIIGVKKGGTRALLEILKLHPKVCACGPEMHFFDRYYSNGFQWYRDRMPLCYENEIVVEKTPSYFVMNGVARDMFTYSKLLNDTLKLLVILRDPTTRLISDYTQTRYRSRFRKPYRKVSPFKDLVLKDSNNGTKLVNSHWDAIKIGLYAKHLKRWLNYFTREQVHLVSGEALIKEPYKEIKKVEKFLNLTPFIRPEHFVYNETKKFYCFDRDLSYRNSTATTPPPDSLRCLGTTKGRSHVKISQEVENLVREYYRPFNNELYQLAGRNFGWR